MSLRLGSVADDYTGASDLASNLALNGLRTVQTIGVPPDDLALPEVDAVVVALKSRSIEPEVAVRLSIDAARWLRGRGAGHILFKVCSTFDSTERGNIGPVTDALRRELGAGAVLVNPAFPENGRAVFQGHLFVGAQPLNESPLKDHPLNPMRDSSLVRVMAAQSQSPVGLIPFATVEAGADAVRAAIATAGTAGQGAMIADAVAPRHLDALGEAALDAPLSVGASGLGAGLARALVRRHGATAAIETDLPALEQSPAAILAGSCSAMTLRQIAAAQRHMPVLRLDVDRLLDGDAAVLPEAFAWARERLASGPILIASSADPAAIRALQARHGGQAAGHAVEAAMAEMAEQLLASGVRRLVVAGGETSGAVVDRLGLQAFLVGREIAPGVPALRCVGARHSGLAVALKSGNFGGDEFFAEALAALA